MKNFYFTSESVAIGHPDKIADFVSDSILDDFLTHDEFSKVAVETLVTSNLVVLAGEVNSKHKPDYEKIVKQAITKTRTNEPNFNIETLEIVNRIHAQSAEINYGVTVQQGAGDQGIMFGYATNETSNFMPAPIYYAHKILQEFDHLQQQGETRLKPDAKAQVTFEYKDGKPYKIKTILCSHQHTKELTNQQLLIMLKSYPS